MIIDCHVHRYPSAVSQDPNSFAKAQGENHWLKLVAPKDQAVIQGWADREKMIADMDAGGVNQCILLAWYWETPATCSLHNQWHANWIKEDPERFIAFAAAHPGAGDQTIDELKRARDSGFRGIGEIMPVVQGFSVRDPSWRKIMEFAIDEDWPVNFHVSEPVGRPHLGRVPTPFEDFQWIAETYPELKMILAHWGGLLPFQELNPFMHKVFKNVWYDVAASPLLYESRIFRTVIDVIGADKILYGSDYPLLLYPSLQKEPDFSTYIQEILASGVSEKESEKILGGNFQRLLGLS